MSDLVAVALVSSIPPTVAALASLIVSIRNGRKTDELHIAVNSRLTELLATTHRAGHAEGIAEEKARGTP